MPFYEVMKGPDPVTGLFISTSWEEGPTAGSVLVLEMPAVQTLNIAVAERVSVFPTPELLVTTLSMDTPTTSVVTPAFNALITTSSQDTPLTTLSVPLASTMSTYLGAEVV